jgi:hypothetical protein
MIRTAHGVLPERRGGNERECPVVLRFLPLAVSSHSPRPCACTSTVAGRRFVGSTLWFPYDDEAHAYRHLLTDFHLIARFAEDVYEENRRAVRFLDATAGPGDIVITHHLPARDGIAPHFKREPLARLAPFFANDHQGLVARSQPALWIHGHMHVPSDWRLGETRIVCNPIGYPGDRGTGRLDCVVDV